MGINIDNSDFDKIDLMKDLEIARHALKNNKPDSENVDKSNDDHDLNLNDCGTNLLEWINEDFEEENFVIVQSRKKKRVS